MSNNYLSLQQCLIQTLDRYFEQLDGVKASNVHSLVIREIETVLFKYILEHCRGNQSEAALILGISRGTLRKKLKDLE